MTDPVDTDALRAHVDVCADCGGTITTCRAAPRACCPDCQHFKPAAVDRRALCDEVDRLRAAIDNAPHGDDCAFGTMVNVEEFYPCSCWKADAL